jgi:hypothetical protein
LNSPPQLLLAAIAKIQSNHLVDDPPLFTTFLEVLNGNRAFLRSEATPDVLLEAAYQHVPQGGDSCAMCDRDRTVYQVVRRGQEVLVHYGTIASGNLVVLDVDDRDYTVTC